ncbi:AAA family ATPase [Streptosporangiaceae bacterium NEAU-GS5]|nr:AAA family ATPase [Streptosporangiaceae bacterium NEAU-GS5]
MAALAEYAGEAGRGQGRLVLVAGEAGVGKSALVERLQQELPAARWSWGACDGLFTPRPLGPLFDLADQLGGRLQDLCRSGTDRMELFRALLRQVGEPGVLDVVIVEDIHWADEATLDLLRFAGRRLRDAWVLLIATYRDDIHARGDLLPITLGDLVTQRSTRRIELAPLSKHAVEVLAEGSGWDAAELFRLTGGNSFYVTEVLQADARAVPTSARDAVLARAARLTPPSRAVLDAAALTGSRVDLRLLESITECTPAIVDELLACGLLVADGTWVRFRHEIARLAVAQAIVSHRGAVIHRRILDALRARGCDDDALMAFHAQAAGDDAAVLRHAQAAARRAAGLGAHREAAAQFELALRFAADADSALIAGLQDELSDQLALGDRWQDAADACERALALWREAGDRLREGDSLRRLSRSLWNLCRGDEAVAAAHAAIAVLEPLGPTLELAWAYATLANRWMLCSEHEKATEFALRAQAIAAQTGASDVLSYSLNTQACSASAIGQDWAALMHRALQIALSGRHHEHAGRAYNNLGSIYAERRQFAEAERWFEEGIAYCDEHDITMYATSMRGEQANMLDSAGRWDEAVTLSLEILAVSGPAPANRICGLKRLGVIRARRGEPGIWDCLDEAAASADAAGQPYDMATIRLVRAEAYWLAGNMAEARYEAELADDVVDKCDEWMRGSVASWLARTESARPSRGAIAEPYRLELEGGIREAAKMWRELNHPYEAALVLIGATEEEALLEAYEIFTNLGAAAAAKFVEERRRLLGLQPASTARQTTSASPFGLTAREREVLDLICTAHTNAEIADKLCISAKTAGHHVSAILAKMGAPSRSAAAREAIRLGLTRSGNT